jgi:hypothetical protein
MTIEKHMSLRAHVSTARIMFSHLKLAKEKQFVAA